MNKFKLLTFSTLLIIALASCNNKGNKSTQITDSNKPAVEKTESMKLIKYLEEMGDYVNSRQFPSLIKAASVYEELDGNILIIDLRNEDYYAQGHIKNAVNVSFSNILNYFENDIVPFEYDKIILVCYAGQYASYTTSLLRLMGYGNVYAMRWGMSSWNKDFAKDFWEKSVSGKYENKLEKTANKKSTAGVLPEINTGKTAAEEIHAERIQQIFANSINSAFVNADEVFTHPEKYYIINYDRKDKYLSGHIPGAIRYKPGATLGIINEMKTIPADTNIVIYCGTGHNSAFATAYLRLVGYKAQTLIYGNNSFMYDKMVHDRQTLSWLPFTDEEIMDYPYVKE